MLFVVGPCQCLYFMVAWSGDKNLSTINCTTQVFHVFQAMWDLRLNQFPSRPVGQTIKGLSSTAKNLIQALKIDDTVDSDTPIKSESKMLLTPNTHRNFSLESTLRLGPLFQWVPLKCCFLTVVFLEPIQYLISSALGARYLYMSSKASLDFRPVYDFTLVSLSMKVLYKLILEFSPAKSFFDYNSSKRSQMFVFLHQFLQLLIFIKTT